MNNELQLESETRSAANIWSRLADLIPRIKTPIQLAGLALAIGGFVAIRTALPNATKAQISSGAIGVAFLVFGQVFVALRNIPSNQRARFIIVVFSIFCFFVIILIAITSVFVAEASRGGRSLNAEELRVIELKRQIVALITRFEQISINSKLAVSEVNEHAPKLGTEILRADDLRLDRSRQIIKYEYASYAFMMAASTESSKSKKNQFATTSIDNAIKAKSLLKEAEHLYAKEIDARITIDWMTQDDDGPRIDYLRAMSTCIKGEALADNSMIANVRIIIDDLPTSYKQRFPPTLSTELSPCLKEDMK